MLIDTYQSITVSARKQMFDHLHHKKQDIFQYAIKIIINLLTRLAKGFVPYFSIYIFFTYNQNAFAAVYISLVSNRSKGKQHLISQ